MTVLGRLRLARKFRPSRKSLPAAAIPVLAATLVLMPARSAHAWGDTGHKVVAAVAWNHMSPQTRARVISVLETAPSDSDIKAFRPTTGTTAERNRRWFIALSTWPDFVRPKDDPTPHQRHLTQTYHEGNWHFINFFWTGGEGVTPADHPTLRPPTVNAVERIGKLGKRNSLAPSSPPRAAQIAWLIHLVGDLHQPLHTSARVTSHPAERSGDKGGNTFFLNASGSRTLHGYWDSVPERSFARQQGETTQSYIDRFAASVETHFPRTTLQSELFPGQVERWAKEGLATSKSKVYLNVQRGMEPDGDYADRAFVVVEPALAKAGYRLAQLMNTIFAQP